MRTSVFCVQRVRMSYQYCSSCADGSSSTTEVVPTKINASISPVTDNYSSLNKNYSPAIKTKSIDNSTFGFKTRRHSYFPLETGANCQTGALERIKKIDFCALSPVFRKNLPVWFILKMSALE